MLVFRQMDQEAFFSITDTDLKNVNLNTAPTSGEEYLRQVILSRKNVPNVVVADLKTIPGIKATEDNNTSTTPSTVASNSSVGPPDWWREKQCSDFSDVRQKLKRLKARASKSGDLKKILKGVRMPSRNDEDGWKTFCFKKCQEILLKNVDAEYVAELKRIHNGTPPLLTVVLAMDQPRVIEALEYHTAWLTDDGYDKSKTQWLYALLCVLEKPLEPEVCSTLRDLAKTCAKIKQANLNEMNDENLTRICNWFICIVACYFDQKDLINL